MTAGVLKRVTRALLIAAEVILIIAILGLLALIWLPAILTAN
jgi:hypothetical protein